MREPSWATKPRRRAGYSHRMRSSAGSLRPKPSSTKDMQRACLPCWITSWRRATMNLMATKPTAQRRRGPCRSSSKAGGTPRTRRRDAYPHRGQQDQTGRAPNVPSRSGEGRAARSRVAAFLLGCLLEGFLAFLGRRVREAHGNPVREPEIDRRNVAREQALLAVEARECRKRLLDVAVRQPHVDAVLQPQVPAPLADQDRGAHPVAERRILVEHGEE